MALAAKVWGPGEHEPPDGVMTHLVSAPPNWFREDPPMAAELYALERGRNMPYEYTVYVRDVDGILHRFEIKSWIEHMVGVKRM